MLVDHLTDAVLQQHHELVKGVNLTLQFDAVHQVDGNRHPLLAQGVQKGVLEGLAFGHRVLLIFAVSFELFDDTKDRTELPCSAIQASETSTSPNARIRRPEY